MTALDRSTASRTKVRILLVCLGAVALAGLVVSVMVGSPGPDSRDEIAVTSPAAPRDDAVPQAPAPAPTTDGSAGPPDTDASVEALDDDPEPVEADVVDAHQAAADFAGAYATYSYDDPPAESVERVRSFVTPELAAELARSSGAAAGRQELVERQQRASGAAFTVHTDAVGDSHVDVLVVVRQEVTSREGAETRWPTYLLRVVPTDAGWRVSGLLR